MTRFRAFACAALLILVPAAVAAGEETADPLAPIAALAGDWTGGGEGEPGKSTATRHIVRGHGDHFIVAEGRSVYAPQEKNPKGETHTSTDTFSYDRARKLIVLRTFGSLGFVSTYVEDAAASTPGHLVLVSEGFENVPPGFKERYAYDFSPDSYREHFELDWDGTGLRTYVMNEFMRAQ